MPTPKLALAEVSQMVAEPAALAETSRNLSFLMQLDANDPELLEIYAKLSDERLKILANMLRGANTQMDPAYLN